MEEIIKPSGSTKASKPDSGGANIRSVPVYGVVKNNVDPIRAGRLQVYISDFGSNDPDDPSGWTTVSYLSPFYGFVNPKSPNTGYGDYVNNASSYGFWNSPPDVGTTVLCIFVNGDPSYGYYIGCVPKPEALYMVPAIGASEYIIPNNEGEAQGYGGTSRLPVTNINTNNSGIADSPNFIQEARPVHSYSAAVMNQQGIIRDPIRGPISSSAQRETPSRVGWGVSTPGRPIYEGGYTDQTITNELEKKNTPPENLRVIARRGGHSIVMDDGDLAGRDQLVRIRTAKGHQITMSDDGQTLFIIHSNGQSYIELGKEGTIDLYSTNSVNIRTQGDLNLHADNNVNIHAAKKMNIYAEEMNIQSDKDTNHKVGGNYSASTIGTHTHKVLGPMSFKSNGDSSFASSSDTYINGAKINLNTGSSSTTPQSVQPIQQIAHSDTLHDKAKGWVAAPGKLKSITSRTPAHAPWADAGKGVDVKVNNSAAAALPPEPSAKVAATNATAATTQQAPSVLPANISTVPSTPDVSKSIDAATSGAMISAAAQATAAGPAAAAATKGATIINSPTGPQAVVGVLAQSPKQLEMAGILKPGSAERVNSLIKDGSTIAGALAPNMFTGKNGAVDLKSYAKNVNAQVNAQSTNYQIAQSGLTSSGVITGKESPTAIAGLVMAGASLGLGPTLRSVQQVVNAGSRLPAAGVPGNTSEINKVLNAGMYAATIAQTLGGGKAVSSAVATMKQLDKLSNAVGLASRGATTAAFVGILESIKPLIAGQPQNLRQIAKDAASSRNSFLLPAGTSQVINSVAKAVGGSTGSLITSGVGVLNAADQLGKATSVTGTINAANQVLKGVNILGSVLNTSATNTAPVARTVRSTPSVSGSILGVAKSVGVLTNPKSSTSAVTSATVNLIGGITNIVTKMSSSASGLDNLPGGSVLSTTPSTIRIPQGSPLSSLVKNSVTAATSGTSLQNSISGMAGSVGGLAGQATSMLADASSKLLGDLKSGTTTLSALAFNNLSPDAAATLNSAIASTASNSSTGTKMPVAGEETFDRGSVDAQTVSLLGDPRIEPPNFTGRDPNAPLSAAEESFAELRTAIIEKEKEIKSNSSEISTLRNRLQELKTTLPAGDPAISAVNEELKVKIIAGEKLESELLALIT